MRSRPRFICAAAIFSVVLGLCWGTVSALPQPATTLEVRLAEMESAVGLTEATVSGSGQKIYLHSEAVVTNADVIRARVVPGNGGRFNVDVVFSNDGSAKMTRATQSHLQRPLAILVNGRVIAAPIVRDQISGSAVISGDFSSSEAEAIAAGLNSR